MKRIKYIFLFVLLFVISCRENMVEFKDDAGTGKIFLSSSPSGADIYFENNKTGKTTPDSLTSLLPGSYIIKLRLVGYSDELVNVTLQSGQRKFINVSFGSDY